VLPKLRGSTRTEREHGSVSAKRAWIGTSDWTYEFWREDFYAGVPRAPWLAHYARHFAAVEVNATFYHTLRPETFARWRDQTPGRSLAQDIAERVGRFLECQGLLERDAQSASLAELALDEEPMEALLSHSITYRSAVGPRGGRHCPRRLAPRRGRGHAGCSSSRWRRKDPRSC
jgi:hypothetical protein